MEDTQKPKHGMRILWEKWKAIARVIGNFNSRIILTLFYFLVVGLFATLVGRWRNELGKRLPSETNWLPVAGGETMLEDAKRQF